jgi:cell division protein FtsB
MPSDIQQAHLGNMANRLAQLQKETLSKAEDYDRLLQVNRALVKEINSLRSGK